MTSGFIAGVLLALASAASAAEITLQAAKDNTLFADNGAYSSGAGPRLFIGNIASGDPRRVLLQFDLSSIPPASVVSAVTLRIYVDRSAIGSSGSDAASLHRVTESWGEGSSDGGTGGGGTQASPEDATWTYRFYGNPSAGLPRVPWSSEGGSFLPDASAVALLAGNGPVTFESSAGLLADVQAWVNDPATNAGWIVRGNEARDQAARRILSRSSGTADAPRLTVVYTPAVSVPLDGPLTRTALFAGLAAATMLVAYRSGRIGR
jgi:hypothetical protein